MKKDWKSPRSRADVEKQIPLQYQQKDRETQERRELTFLLQECAFSQHIPVYCAIDAEEVTPEERQLLQQAAQSRGSAMTVRGAIVLGTNIREMFLFAEQGVPETQGIRQTTAAQLIAENYLLRYRELLEIQGYQTIIVEPEVMPDPELAVLLSVCHKGAAGRNSRFIAGAYGQRVCCGMILTDAPLMGGDYRFPDYPQDICRRLCGSDDNGSALQSPCIAACPAGAFRQEGERVLFQKDVCSAWRDDPENQEQVDAFTVRKCMKCMEACPAH